jgi:hypothetical protein
MVRILAKMRGIPTPLKQVRLQAEADGYKDLDIMAMLEINGLGESYRNQVPEEFDKFGELWAEVPSITPSPEPSFEKIQTSSASSATGCT